MATFSGFPKTTTKFLRELSRNNDRDWFNANKDRYEAEVREPALEFISAMEKPIARISECFDVVPKKVGGSLMRVYRDTRFSKDKTPYKTNIGIHFRHQAGKDVHAPGFYVHIEPKDVFLGAGIWHPDTTTLAKIRERIADDPDAWAKVRDHRAFKKTFALAGDSLKRPPRGYDADHAAIEDLKRKDFIGVCNLEPGVVHEKDFIKRVTSSFKATQPLVQFLCETLHLPF